MNGKAILGVALIAAAICLAAGGVYTVHILKKQKFDPETLCPLEGPKAVTLILIDKTDPLTPSEQARVRGLIAAEADAVQSGGRITVKLLQQREGASETALGTAADLCNPGAEGNPLFENPRRVAARYESAFREPIEAALASIKGAGSAPASPIARAIEETMGAVPEGPGLKLILVSDMMEHTPEASAYSGSLTEAALRKVIPARTRSRFKGTEVRILLLGRPRYPKQQAAAMAIWRSFFRTASGREPDFERL
jgi:hypothetical protein